MSAIVITLGFLCVIIGVVQFVVVDWLYQKMFEQRWILTASFVLMVVMIVSGVSIVWKVIS